VLHRFVFVLVSISDVLRYAEAGGDSDMLVDYFPSFLWLVRDFALKLKDENDNDITSKDYLENALREKAGDKQKEKNEVRKVVKQFFSSRDCVTLVRPVVDESQLHAIDKIKFTELRSEFRNQMTAFKSKVFGELKPKRVMGHTIAGRAFASLLQAYVSAVNTGGVPAIHTAFHSMALIENQQTFEAAKLSYRNVTRTTIDGKYPLDDKDLAAAHNNAMQSALDTFKSNVIGEDTGTLLDKLNQFFQEEMVKHNDKNLASTKALSEKLILELVAPLHEQMRQGKFKTIDEVMQSWANMQGQYSKRAHGTMHAIVESLNNAVPAHLHKLVVQFSAHLQNQAQAKLDEQRKKEDELNKKVMDARKEVEQAQAKAHKSEVDLTKFSEQSKQQAKEISLLEEDKKRLNAEKNALTATVASREAEIKVRDSSLNTESIARRSAEKELELATKTIKMLQDEKEALSASIRKVESKYEAAEKQRAQLETRASVLEEKVGNQKELFDGSTKSFKDKIAVLESDLSAARSQIAELSKNMDSSGKKLQASLDHELKKNADLSRATKSLEEQIKALQDELKVVSDSRDAAVAAKSANQKKEGEEIAKLRKELQQQAQEITKLKSTSEEIATGERNLKQERDALKKDQVESKKLLSDAEKHSHALAKQIENLQAEKRTLEKDFQASKTAQNELAKQLAAAAASTKTIEENLLKKVAELEASRSRGSSTMIKQVDEESREDSVVEEEAPKPAKKAAAVRARAKATSAAKAKAIAVESDSEDGVEAAPAPPPKSARGKSAPKAVADDDDEPTAARKANRGKRKRPEDDASDEKVEAPAKRAKVDPNSMTKPQLKSELTKMGVKLPTKDQPKSVYVEIYEKSVN
jgi:hypothetical protein